MNAIEKEIEVILQSKFNVGDKVEKFTGDYVATGEVRCVYTTSKGARRYVVEIKPQGFQMIFNEEQLRINKWSR